MAKEDFENLLDYINERKNVLHKNFSYEKNRNRNYTKGGTDNMKLVYTGDFERLKDFGFEYDSHLSDNFEEIYSVQKEYQKLCILKNDGTIFLYEPFNSNAFILKNIILYDLISAGLVKKVGENE